MDNACKNKKDLCKAFQENYGRTNLLQKVEGPCYTCRLGYFNITRNIEDLPRKCNSMVAKQLGRIKIKED